VHSRLVDQRSEALRLPAAYAARILDSAVPITLINDKDVASLKIPTAWHHAQVPRRRGRLWYNELHHIFAAGMNETPRRLDTRLCYEAPGRATGWPATTQLRRALEADGQRRDPKRLPPGLEFHAEHVITRGHYYMHNADKHVLNDEAAYLEPLIRNRILIEWGPGDGEHALTLAKRGAPFLYVGIDRSKHNLDQTRAKLRTVMPNRHIVTLQNEFYQDPTLWENPVWEYIKTSGVATTDIILGGTPFNTRKEQRIPFLENVSLRRRLTPKVGGPNALMITTDWTQDQETIQRAYNHPSYRQFYLNGLALGCTLARWQMDLQLLDYRVTPDDYGIVTQLANRESQFVTLEGSYPTKSLFHLAKDEVINCTIAEKPRPHSSILEFRDAGWAMVARRSVLEQTLLYRDPVNPLARVGICVLIPA
jgi:uncharacterized SAM-dependent methyltransferase